MENPLIHYQKEIEGPCVMLSVYATMKQKTASFYFGYSWGN